ncbi:amino acid permease-domain-containing protein [Chaetomium fimeti]|uniref:Amino acid permease-domain-containing protein n=1 Tax=Chaetomium fimeti TaxID=1854472 RepID=A0AAE0HQ91_9PEZI|nr:amino acid permease-domain-containing protein [Chaetomium fimeti]
MSAPSEDGGPERRPLLAAVTTGGEREWEGRASGDGVGDADTEERAVGGGVGTFTRNLGAVEAFAIVISIVIGSGVFTSPGSIDTNVPSPGAALLVWLVGGVLAWTGASTMAELGTAIPGEGGVQPYLKYIFGDVFGFLAAWTWVVAVMPATLAILSIVFIESIYSAAGVTGEGDRIVHKLLSIAVLACIGVANSISTKASTRLNNFFVATKFITIAAIVLAGVVVVVLQLVDPNRQVGGGDWREKPWFGYRDSVNPDGSVTHWDGLGQWDMFGHLSAALYAALWAYSGWDKAIYISAELSAPARQLPLAINTSLPSIILCFLAANAVYYILLPWNVVATTDSVAVTAITRLLGPGFGIVAAVFICLVVAGSLLGNSFVAGRMAVAAANQNWLPRPLAVVGRVGPDREHAQSDPDKESEPDAPINAIILSTALAAIYILLGNFRALLTFNGLGEYTFFFLTVLGAIILRYRQPELARPYKPFVLIPIIFALVSGFVVVRGAAFAPTQALILVGLWALGLVFYFVRRRGEYNGGLIRVEDVSNKVLLDAFSCGCSSHPKQARQYHPMSLPALPRRAAYITLNTPQRRNALSLTELRSLRDQLLKANTSPTTGRTLLLPPFKPSLLSKLERSHATLTNPPTTPLSTEEDDSDYTWLTSSRTFATARHNLPSVLVLASHGPVFSSGHDLRELRTPPTPQAVSETFRLCAEVMSLIRRSPALVVGRIQGAAVAAGCQLALTADLPVAHAGVRLRLPGAGLGLPCSSPVAAVGRRVGNGRAFWMLAMAEEVGVREVGDVVRVVEGRVGVLDREVLRTVERLVGMSPQQSAMGKWAFWTQAGLTGRDFVGPDGEEVEGSGGDGYMDAVEWTGRVMALHAKSEDAKEGMDAFLEKRKAAWCGFEKQ